MLTFEKNCHSGHHGILRIWFLMLPASLCWALLHSEQGEVHHSISDIISYGKGEVIEGKGWWIMRTTSSQDDNNCRNGLLPFSVSFVWSLLRKKRWSLASSGATWNFCRCSQSAPASQYKQHFYAAVAAFWASWAIKCYKVWHLSEPRKGS